MSIELRYFNAGGVDPTYGSEHAACFDLHSTYDYVSHSKTTIKVQTGLFLEIPEGHVGLVFPRSGLATNKGLTLANSVGVIDSDYRGEVMCAISNLSPYTQYINKEDRIAQMMIIPVDKVDFVKVENQTDLSSTNRGEGGFGSTGK